MIAALSASIKSIDFKRRQKIKKEKFSIILKKSNRHDSIFKWVEEFYS